MPNAGRCGNHKDKRLGPITLRRRKARGKPAGNSALERTQDRTKRDICETSGKTQKYQTIGKQQLIVAEIKTKTRVISSEGEQ